MSMDPDAPSTMTTPMPDLSAMSEEEQIAYAMQMSLQQSSGQNIWRSLCILSQTLFILLMLSQCHPLLELSDIVIQFKGWNSCNK